MIRCVVLTAHTPVSWNSFPPRQSARSNLKGIRAGLSGKHFMSEQKCESRVQSSFSDACKFISFSPDRSWSTMSNSGSGVGSLSLFFISEEKSSPRADICLLLAPYFLSRLANFVHLNGTFKLFLHYDSLSWQGVKYNNRNRAEQKIMLEKKKAGQTGRVIHVTLRKKLNVWVLAVLFNKILYDGIRVNKNVLKRKSLY